MKDIRAFIAIELPEEQKKALGELSTLLAERTGGYKWVKPAAMHLTLRFLGYLGPAAFAEVAETVGKGVKAGGPVSLTPSGVGAFPDERRARVIWAGLGGETNKLYSLVSMLDAKLEKLGLPPESRPFKAHLTLARIDKECRGSGLKIGRELREWSAPGWTASEIVLFESVLSIKGARHIERARGKIT